jgi:hypothetical protein
MPRNTETDREARQLRALLTMSRESMQTDQALKVLALAGRATADLAHVDSALLLVRGEVNASISFNRMGKPCTASSSHDFDNDSVTSILISGTTNMRIGSHSTHKEYLRRRPETACAIES